MKKLFSLLFLGMFFFNLVSADLETSLYCGGDLETQIFCYGDLQNAPAINKGIIIEIILNTINTNPLSGSHCYGYNYLPIPYWSNCTR